MEEVVIPIIESTKSASKYELKLPSFLRDWVLKKFEDESGSFDTEELLEFVNTYMPRKEDWI